MLEPHLHHVPQDEVFARHDLGMGHLGRHLEAQAALHDPIEEQALLVHHGVGGQARQDAPHRHQRGDAGGGVLGVELRDDRIGLPPDLGATGHASPGGIDSIENVLGRGLAAEELERLGPRPATAAAEVAKAL